MTPGPGRILAPVGLCTECMSFNLILIYPQYMWALGLGLIVEMCVVVGGFLLVWKARELAYSSFPSALVENYRPNAYSILDPIQRQVIFFN